MQQPPRVSPFTLHPGPLQPPHVPLLIRSRQKHHPISTPTPLPFLQPRQIVIEVGTLDSNLPKKHQGIRASIDACLAAIEEVEFNYRRKFSQQNSPGHTVTTKEQTKRQIKEHLSLQASPAEGRDSSIHRIDRRLILDYLATVGQDYALRDPFGNGNSKANPQTSDRFDRSCRSVDNRHRKHFISLTQASRMSRKDQSPYQRHRTSPRNQQVEASNLKELTPARPLRCEGQLNKGLRYCINCEKAIESVHIDHHQQHCPGLQELYNLSFEQLSELVEGKIRRVARELEEHITWLLEHVGGARRLDKVTEITLNKLKEYLHTVGSTSNSSQKYVEFEESLLNPFFDSVELARRLHWFTQVHIQLTANRKSDKTQSSALRAAMRGKFGSASQSSPIGSLVESKRRESQQEQSPLDFRCV